MPVTVYVLTELGVLESERSEYRERREISLLTKNRCVSLEDGMTYKGRDAV